MTVTKEVRFSREDLVELSRRAAVFEAKLIIGNPLPDEEFRIDIDAYGSCSVSIVKKPQPAQPQINEQEVEK